MEQNCLKCFSAWDVYIWVCRISGTITAMLLWGVAVEITYYGDPGFHVGFYLIFVALVVSFFEAVFIVIFWIELIKRDQEQSCCICTWKKVFGWVDDWRKGLLYLIMSPGCFLEPKTEWLAFIPGVMLVISGILYIIKTLKTRRDIKEEIERSKNQSYGRFDAEVQEDIEDSALSAGPGVSGVTEDSRVFSIEGEQEEVEETVEDQEEILDV